MEDFQFIFCVNFIDKILENVNVVSKIHQSPKQELTRIIFYLIMCW
jgi:hypothetical protein